ncbi:MAG: hypothetical protein ACE5FT_06275 [Candidatus Nanoarchaeia archaeon]
MDRGQVETQFNWMFVMIAGAVILLAVFAFILRHRASTNREIAETFIKQLDEITTSAGIAKGTARIADLPPLDVDMVCTKECACTITAMGSATTGFEDKILFGPGYTEGNIMLWAQEWAVPFRAGNFVYITSRDVKYYIVGGGTPLLSMLKEKIPDLMDADFVTDNALLNMEYPGHGSVKVVYVDMAPPYSGGAMNFDPSWRREDVSVVHLTSQSATFYTKTSSRQLEFDQSIAIPYYGDAALFAAVFASDSNMFSCGLYKAAERLHLISQLYLGRTKELNTIDVCALQNYDEAEATLSNLVDVSAEMRDNLAQMGQMPDLVQQLNDANKRAGVRSCPYIY